MPKSNWLQVTFQAGEVKCPLPILKPSEGDDDDDLSAEYVVLYPVTLTIYLTG